MEEINIQDPNELKRKSKYSNFTENLKEYFLEYSGKAHIHGVRYVGEKNRSIVERLIWLAVLAISAYVCIFSINEIYTKWKAAHNIVQLAKGSSPLWKIPFPAVTICAETKVRQTIFNFTDAYHKYLQNPEDMTEEELKHFEQTGIICDSHLATSSNLTTGYDTVEYIHKVAPEFLWHCEWAMVKENATCNTLFTPSLTDEGVCYTFNMLNRDELLTEMVFRYKDFLEHEDKASHWTLETGYDKTEGTDMFPKRTYEAGPRGGLRLLLTLLEQDFDYICRGPLQGFKVFIHSPVDLPRVTHNYFRAPPNQAVVLSITPHVITTSKDLKKYDPRARGCYFNHEKQLKYFQVYTQRNCEVECITNYTLNRCGCVPYYMPRDETINICGTGSNTCVYEAEVLAKGVPADIEIFENNDYTTSEDICNCLPTCTSISYNAESSQTDFDWKNVMKAYKVNLTDNEYSGLHMTRVTIFFKEDQFITHERIELYDIVDFLAKCGGLLALYFGFSFLSVFEIIYFLTLRLFCNIKMFGRHFSSTSSQLLNEENYV